MPASPRFPDLPSSWIETTETLAPQGIFLRLWHKRDVPQNPRVLFLVHGFGEHSDRYRHWPHYLNSDVDVIAISDLCGHGRSAGNRGSCRSSEDWLTGVERAYKSVETWVRNGQGIPQIAVLGHSFGGLLTIELARQNRWHAARALFASAPLLALAETPPAWKTLLGRMIEPLFPQLPLANDIAADVVSRDPEVIRHYVLDPLNHSKITPRGYVQMTALMEKVRQSSAALPAPFTLILPGADPLVSTPTSFAWYQRLEMTEDHAKRLCVFPGFRHESFNEVDKALAFNALSNWLQGTWAR